jgi:hypothetical protein
LANVEKQIGELLHTAGARLIRNSRHPVYRFPNGRNFVTASTPSDNRDARNTLAELRRVLASHAQLAEAAPKLVQLCDVTEKPRPRVRIPNRPPRETVEDQVIRFHQQSSGREQETHAQQPAKSFTDLEDVFGNVAAAPGFWDLDTCGRLRVLAKLIRQFAKVEALPYRHCAVRFEEYVLFSAEVRSQLLFDLMNRSWQGLHVPCLLVHDDLLGDILIEVEAMQTHGGEDNIIALSAEFSRGVYLHLAEFGVSAGQGTEESEASAALVKVNLALAQMRLNPDFETVRTQIDSVMRTIESKVTLIPSSEASDNRVLYEFIELPVADKYGIRFKTTESWTNPNLCRSVIRHALQIREDRRSSC